MPVNATQIKELRSRSGSGILSCKKALEENDANIEKAVIWLRKKGLTSAVKKSTRATNEGVVAIHIDKNNATIIELAAETDFVSKNDKFLALATNLVQAAHRFDGNNIDKFLISGRHESIAVNELIAEHISIIGENIVLKKLNKLHSSKGVIVPYLHNKLANNIGKIAVLVLLEGECNNKEVEQLGRQLAMHIAASKPMALNIKDLDPVVVNKEKDILKEQSLETNKSESIINKIVEGRMKKFFESNVLLEQPFIINDKIKVKEAIEGLKVSTKCNFSIVEYIRYEIGQ